MASNNQAQQRLYAELWAERSDLTATKSRVAAIRLNSSTVSALMAGQVTTAYLYGTEENPGWVRRQLMTIVNREVLHPQVKLSFRIADERGIEFTARAAVVSSARAAAEAAFKTRPTRGSPP